MENKSNNCRAITIDRNKVYSSYYARAKDILPSVMMVAISLNIPDYFTGKNICRELNPPCSLLYRYKNGLCSKEEYIREYTAVVLDRLSPEEIYNKLKGKVILCYCKKGEFCHRKLVLEWLANNIGDDVVGGEL